MPGRAGKQCRERWHNHLCPNVIKSDWTEEEQWRLFLSHKLNGNKWTQISAVLQGRSDNSIKNHWNSKMRKKLPFFKEKLDKLLEEKDGAKCKFRRQEVIKEILDQLSGPSLDMRELKPAFLPPSL
jgi:hypothetical protein